MTLFHHLQHKVEWMHPQKLIGKHKNVRKNILEVVGLNEL